MATLAPALFHVAWVEWSTVVQSVIRVKIEQNTIYNTSYIFNKTYTKYINVRQIYIFKEKLLKK